MTEYLIICRLSTILPYLSLHNNQNLTKDNEKRSLYLLIPSQTRDEYKKPKEISRKTKRCGTSPRKNRFFSLSRKEDTNRAKMNTRSLNKNIKTLIKSVKYSQENPATSNRIKTEIHKDTFLQSLKNNLNAENVMLNSESRVKTKKNDKENCICYCKEENCASKSSIKNSSEILSSSRKDKSEKTNHQRLAIQENTKSNILQQISPKLYHKNLHELHVPSSINSFPTQFYQEKVRDIPRVAILYGKPNILPHIIGNEKKFIGVPFTTFEDRPNFLAKSNAYNQPIIRQNLNPCPRKVEEARVESPVISTSSSTSYIDDVTTITQTESGLESTEKDQENFFKSTIETSTDHVDMSIDSKMETNFYSNYSNDVDGESSTIDFSNSNETTNKVDDFTESIVGNQDDDFSTLMSSSTNNVDRSETSPIIFPSIMHDEKLINMEECIKLFGRDVCVLSAYSVTSPEVLTKQAQKNNMNEYSTIRIPEYIVRMSAKEGTTSNNVDYSDKFRTTEMSNVDSNDYLESTSTELTVDDDENFLQEFYAGSIEHTDEPNNDYDKLFNSEEDTLIPMKKMMDRIIDKITKTAKNTQLGKSNSHKVESLLSPNNKETTSSILHKEETTTISYDFQTGYNFEEKITNRLIESGIDSSRERKILQGQSEEIATINYDSKVTYNFEEKSMHDLKKLNTNFDPEDEILQFKEEIIPISSDSNTKYNVEEVTENDLLGIKTVNPGDEIFQEQFEMQYLDHEGTDYLNSKEDITNSLETIIDSSSEKLPFDDNTLLLNSIRKVINDFASNASSAKTKDLNESILLIQGSNLLPEILQIPNLESILLIPQIENTIVEKVKDVLSDIAASPRGHFTNDWSHDVIRNTFRSILQALSSNFHRKLPPMTVEEHQFKNGQWTIDSITLAPVLDRKVSLANPENLRKNIRNLLNSSAIASQIDHYIVRNMIVQSVKNSVTKNEHEEIESSIIHELNDILRTLKDSEDTDVLGKNNKFIDNEKNVDLTSSQIISTDNYEKGINIANSISINKQNSDIEDNTKIDNKNMPIYKINENVTDQISNEIRKIDMQDDEVKEKLAESSKIAVTYHKAISKNNLGIISAISAEPNLIEVEELNDKKENILTTTISSIMTENFDESEKNIPTQRIKDNYDNNKSSINHYSLDNQIFKYIKKYRTNDENIQVTTIPSNFIKETSPKTADGIISKNTMGFRDIGDEHIFNGEILAKSIDSLKSPTNVKHQNENLKIASSIDEIDPAIILERIEHNLSPIKYYSPEILKYIKSHRDNDDNDVNVKLTTTNFLQETSPDYTQMSNDIMKLNYDNTLTTSAENVISSLNTDYGNYESEITPSINTDIFNLQQHNFVTKGNVIDKIHEVTTEVQRTYAKTTYFKVKPSADDNSKISSSLLAYTNNNNKDKNSDSYNDNLIGNRIHNIDNTETNKQRTISCSKSCFLGNIYPLQLFPSDSIKLPVEIEKLKDGSYALSITKNICEQILKRKCSCCVPLQGHLILSWDESQDEKDLHMTSDRENMYTKNVERDHHSTESPSVMKTLRKNTLKVQKAEEEEEKERMRAHDLWKRNLNDNNLITILMPVIDFAKKYLLLDSNKTESHDIVQKSSLMKSVGKFDNDQLKEKNLNDIFETRKKNKFVSEIKDITDKLQNSVNFRERKDTLSINFPRSSISRDFHNSKNSIEIESRKKNSKANQFEITEKLRTGTKLETEKNIQNINTEGKINTKNQKRNPILKRINISEENTEIKNEEMKSNKYRIADVEKGNYYIN